MAEGDEVLCRLYNLDITSPEVDATRAEIFASIELESLDKEGLRLKDFIWDTSANQAARRIKTGMCLFALAYLQGYVPDLEYYSLNFISANISFSVSISSSTT